MSEIVWVIGSLADEEPLVWHKERLLPNGAHYLDRRALCGKWIHPEQRSPQYRAQEVNLAHIPNAGPCPLCVLAVRTPRERWGTCCPSDPACEHSFLEADALTRWMDTPMLDEDAAKWVSR